MPKETTKATRALVHGFFKMYPGEAAKFLNGLSIEEVLEFFRSEHVTTTRELLARLNHDRAAELILHMEDELFRKLFTVVDPSCGATLLARLDAETVSGRLSLLPPRLAEEYRELMTYPPGTAGNLMDPKTTTFGLEDSIERVLRRIRAVPERRIIDVCVVDQKGNLVAVVPLQDIAVARPNQQIGDLVRSKPVSVHSMATREDVVQLLEEKKLASLPVVDMEGRLQGVIRYDALVTAAQQEASQDVQSMFGAGRDERALSKVSFAVRKRLPWLEINLATAFLAASVVGLFEGTIARFTALAVFLPVVAGQSGNTGSQALAVTMRGLALREIRTRHWLRISGKEVAVGLLNGLVVAATTALVVYLWMSSIGLAAVIGVAMVISMVIAGFSGAVIPITLKAFGQDPAQSSSIILTTVTDVVGFMSFLGLATLLVGVLHIS